MTTNYGKDVLNLVGYLKTLVLDILIYKETVYSEQHNDLNESNEHATCRARPCVPADACMVPARPLRADRNGRGQQGTAFSDANTWAAIEARHERRHHATIVGECV